MDAGFYISLGGSNVSITYGSNGVLISAGGQASVVYTVSGSVTVSFDSTGANVTAGVMHGIGTPTGTGPVTFSWLMDPSGSGVREMQIGGGINDIFEIGGKVIYVEGEKWYALSPALAPLFEPITPEQIKEANRRWSEEYRPLDYDRDPIYRKLITPTVADLFDRAKQWVQPVDPIILDLDGNGLKTVGLDANIYFDHDGDGILTRTGWVDSGDALLVLDRNGNGNIDTGAELFGDFTPLPNGALAPNGFAALAAFDDNGDGIIDANDAIFSQLRLWRDSNQDGVTNEGELITLEEAGIVGLNLGNTVKNQAMGNGNTLAREGSFIWADGSTGAMGEFKLATDTFHRQFADAIEIPEDLQSLPNMGGAGKVRDLQEAATLSNKLTSLIEQYANATTRAEQMALLDQLLAAWADTGGMQSLEERGEGKYEFQYNAFGNDRRIDNYANQPNGGSGGGASSAGGGGGGPGLAYDIELTAYYQNLIAEWTRKLQILEAFNGQYFFTLPNETSQTTGAQTGLSVGASAGGGSIGMVNPGLQTLYVSFSQQQLDLLQQSYDALKESVYAGLVLQTRLKPYLDSIELSINENGIGFDTSAMRALLEERRAADPQAALVDLADLTKYAGDVATRQKLAQPAARNMRRFGCIRATCASRLERDMIERRKEFRQRHVQAMADVRQRLHRWIGQTALDCRDISAIDLCLKSKRFLRLVGGMPTLLDAPAERKSNRSAAWL